MKRGIFIILIIILLSFAVFSLNNPNDLTEKDLIESCRFSSSGPEVVLQKTIQGDILIWLYESNKEEFGDLVRITDFEKISENKYKFRLYNQEYVFEAIVPDYCTRPEKIEQRTSIQEEINACGNLVQGPISVPIDLGSGSRLRDSSGNVISTLACEYETNFGGQPFGQYVPTSGYCVSFISCPEEAEPDSPETSEPTSQPQSRPQLDVQGIASDINRALPKIADFIRNFFNSIFGMQGCTRQPTITPPLNPPVTSTTTEEKCNIEGTFEGLVDSQSIHIFADAPLLFPDVNTDIKNTKLLKIEIKKQEGKELCGVPYKVTYHMNIQGAVLKYLGKAIVVSLFREANLLEIRESNQKFYDQIVAKGVIGGGGVLVSMNRERENYNFEEKKYDKPEYTLIELKRNFYDFIKSKEGQMNLGDWQNYNFEIVFELNKDKTITATISEELFDNKGRTFIKKEDNKKTVTGINIEDYKDYIKILIGLIKSASDTMVFEGDVSSKEGGYVVINGGGYNIKDNINNNKLKVGDSVPQAEGASETKTTIKNEKIEKEQLKNYLDLTE